MVFVEEAKKGKYVVDCIMSRIGFWIQNDEGPKHMYAGRECWKIVFYYWSIEGGEELKSEGMIDAPLAGTEWGVN